MNQRFWAWLWQHFWSQLSVMKLLPNNYQFKKGESLIRGQCYGVFMDRGWDCPWPRAAVRGRMSPECEESCAFITFAAIVLFTGMRTSSWEFVYVCIFSTYILFGSNLLWWDVRPVAISLFPLIKTTWGECHTSSQILQHNWSKYLACFLVAPSDSFRHLLQPTQSRAVMSRVNRKHILRALFFDGFNSHAYSYTLKNAGEKNYPIRVILATQHWVVLGWVGCNALLTN